MKLDLANAETLDSQVVLQAVHDIRSPLSALKILTARLAQSQTSAQTGLMEAIIQRIEKISDDLLAESRRAKTDKSGTLDAAIQTLIQEKRLEHSEIEFSSAVDEKTGQMNSPHADLVRVLSNLMNNAVEAGAKSVEIRSLRKGDAIYLTVGDDGPGMPGNVKALLQTGAQISHGKTGNGLGLCQAWRVVRSLRGNLHFDSKPAGGTEVTLEFSI